MNHVTIHGVETDGLSKEGRKEVRVGATNRIDKGHRDKGSSYEFEETD